MARAATEPPTPGRPLDDDLTERILSETKRVLADKGFAGMCIESIAQTVGCGKTAIYRRWATRGELAVDALLHGADLGTIPDTGALIDDLLAHAWQNVVNQSKLTAADNQVLWTVAIAPEVRELFWDRFMSVRHAMGTTILQRAIERGQLRPDAAIDAILDTLAGLTLFRSGLKGVTVDKAEFRAVVTSLVTAPPIITPARTALAAYQETS